MQSLEEQLSEGSVHSDAALISGVQRRDPSALGLLYDRYAPFVFTLAKSVSPDTAEALTERVFYRLWSSQGILTLPGPLLYTLIDLTEQALRNEPTMIQGNRAGAAIAVLRPFARLSPGIYEVMVLAYVGQLGTSELVRALDLSPAHVREALTSGLKQLRAIESGRDQAA